MFFEIIIIWYYKNIKKIVIQKKFIELHQQNSMFEFSSKWYPLQSSPLSNEIYTCISGIFIAQSSENLFVKFYLRIFILYLIILILYDLNVPFTCIKNNSRWLLI